MTPPAADPAADRLLRQLDFWLELDRAKSVMRRNTLVDGSRREGDGEHMWHVAVLALLLGEHAPAGVDPSRVITMLLLHDVVEIDAGDAFVYDAAARAAAAALEEAAAERIYGLLPPEQGASLRDLWDEFEAAESADARFARALDRLAPMLINAASGGVAWREHGIVASDVAAINLPVIEAGAPALLALARSVLADCVERGVLPAGEGAAPG